jgi:hypothetical protein
MFNLNFKFFLSICLFIIPFTLDSKAQDIHGSFQVSIPTLKEYFRTPMIVRPNNAPASSKYERENYSINVECWIMSKEGILKVFSKCTVEVIINESLVTLESKVVSADIKENLDNPQMITIKYVDIDTDDKIIPKSLEIELSLPISGKNETHQEK